MDPTIKNFIYLNLELIMIVFFLFFFVRLSGNKSLQESTPLEFIYLLLLTSISWDMILEDNYNLIHSFISMSILTIVMYTLDWLVYRYDVIRQLLEGNSKVIIENGKLIDSELKKQRITITELEARLREQGVFNIESIEKAYIEVNGSISVKRKEDKDAEDIQKAYKDSQDHD